MDTENFIWDIYYKGDLVAERVATNDRNNAIMECLNEGTISRDYAPAEIEFRFVKEAE